MKIDFGIYAICLVLALAGCYDDKGNYSYTDVNQMTLSFTPENQGDKKSIYILSQPQVDSLFFEITSVVDHSINSSTNNLSYRWIRSWSVQRGGLKDTVFTDTVLTQKCIFKFPPKVNRAYSVLYIVTDQDSGLEIYQNLTVKTVVPFTRSWLLLHGEAGDRRIGALEYDITRTSLQRKEMDIYENLKDKRRFQNAFTLKFSSVYNSDIYGSDKLFVVQADSISWLYPFTCIDNAHTLKMMPGSWNAQLRSCVYSPPGAYFGLIDDDGKYYHNGAFGYFYEAEKANGVSVFHADRAYLSPDGHATLWDDVNKQVAYYGQNWYNQWQDSRMDLANFRSRITPFTSAELKGHDISTSICVWMGQGITASSTSGASVLLKNKTNEYIILNIGYGGKDKSVSDSKGKDDPAGFGKVEVVLLNSPDFDNNSVFTSTAAFKNQIFYSLGSDIYLYNIINGESSFVYSVGNNKQITRIAFRLDYPGNYEPGDEFILGIATETAEGKGEFHQIVLDEAGDVSLSASYDGFGPIIDFCYTYIQHTFYD